MKLRIVPCPTFTVCIYMG